MSAPALPAAAAVSAVSFVEQLLAFAVRLGASDAHLEPYAEGPRLRLRLDGRLARIDGGPFLETNYPAVVARIKILAAMDIAERRLPQEGGLRYRAARGDVDVRVSTVAAVDGERVAMRFLNTLGGAPGLDALGLDADGARLLRAAAGASHGMALVAGPTGSGKTTTLYAALAGVDAECANILTVEDPVERRLAGVGQCEVREEAGLGFAGLLRAFLRQDPEVILVGEIRDAETADIAMKAAMTGHLVLSTVHSNSASATVMRLANLGVAPGLVASALNLVVAQRLVRKICPQCKRPDPSVPAGDGQLFCGAGCAACAHTGCAGRRGVFEFLHVDAEVRSLIAAGAPPDALARAARPPGLRDGGLRLLRDGVISFAEFQRVFGGFDAGA